MTRPSKASITSALRAQVPPAEVDDYFIAVLADLAASSAGQGARVAPRRSLRLQLAAAAGGVALVATGTAFAADRMASSTPTRQPVAPTASLTPPPQKPAPAEPVTTIERSDKPDPTRTPDETQNQGSDE